MMDNLICYPMVSVRCQLDFKASKGVVLAGVLDVIENWSPFYYNYNFMSDHPPVYVSKKGLLKILCFHTHLSHQVAATLHHKTWLFLFESLHWLLCLIPTSPVILLNIRCINTAHLSLTHAATSIASHRIKPWWKNPTHILYTDQPAEATGSGHVTKPDTV